MVSFEPSCSLIFLLICLFLTPVFYFIAWTLKKLIRLRATFVTWKHEPWTWTVFPLCILFWSQVCFVLGAADNVGSTVLIHLGAVTKARLCLAGENG